MTGHFVLSLAVVAGMAATLAAIAGLVVRYAGLRADREFSRLRRPDDFSRFPLITVIVPARNEERNIGPCLERLQSLEYPSLEVLVVDDHSTDLTPGIVREFAVRSSGAKAPRLLRLADDPGPAEDEWACRKSHALWFGTSQATGDWVLFLDADVRLEPDALWRAMSLVRAHHLKALSMSGTYINPSLWGSVLESTIDPAIFLAVPWRRVNNPDHPAAWMNGNFILFDRAAYLACGGHRTVARFVQDDLSLALLCKERRVPFFFLPVSSAYECRDYVGLGEAFRGWTRRLAAGAARLHLGRLSYFLEAGALFLIGLFPVLVAGAGLLGLLGGHGALGLPLGLWAAAQLGLVIILQAGLRAAMRMSVWPGLLAPFGAALGIGAIAAGFWARFVKHRVDLRGRSLFLDEDGK